MKNTPNLHPIPSNQFTADRWIELSRLERHTTWQRILDLDLDPDNNGTILTLTQTPIPYPTTNAALSTPPHTEQTPQSLTQHLDELARILNEAQHLPPLTTPTDL